MSKRTSWCTQRAPRQRRTGVELNAWGRRATSLRHVSSPDFICTAAPRRRLIERRSDQKQTSRVVSPEIRPQITRVLRYRCASVDAIGGAQAFTLGMRCPSGLAALRLHAAIERELRTRTADLARAGWCARARLLGHARARLGGGRPRDCRRRSGSCSRQRRAVGVGMRRKRGCARG